MEKNTTLGTNPQRAEDMYNMEVRKFGKKRAAYRESLQAERERMRDGYYDYPFPGCTEAELSDWWNEYNAEFGKEGE